MLAYENSSSFVVYAIRMRSSFVGGVKSGNYVGLGMTWGSTLIPDPSLAELICGLVLWQTPLIFFGHRSPFSVLGQWLRG
jgi:hypothetical protein